MKYVIRIAAVLLLLIVAAAIYIYHGLSNRPDIDAFSAFKTFSKANRDPGLRVTFLGVSTLLLDDARVIHETTPIQPDVAAQRGHRDTLVITLRAAGFQGPGAAAVSASGPGGRSGASSPH